MAFDNVRLNVHVESGAKGGPGFKTTVIAQASGKEQRNAEWLFERGAWDLSYGIMSKTDYREITDFFRSRRGMHRGFRFKDWTDYEAVDEVIGTGDGATLSFKLVKDYGYYKKRITRPITGTVSVKINGTPKATGWTVNTATGVITFTNNETHRPAVGEIITASFSFDLPVRFDIDRLDTRVIWEGAGSIPNIPIVELLEDDDELPA
jgi:uncharacterized protein (TIGR02217 family)